MDNDLSKSAAGIVSTDPLLACSIGDALEFRAGPFGGVKSDAINRPNSVTNWEFFNGAVAGFVLKDTGSSKMVGTAIVVAPGLAITATHNFLSELDSMASGTVVPYCMGIRATGLDIWKVAKLNYTATDDIAFLSLEAASRIPDDRAYYGLGITTRAPKNGEELHIVGFRSEGEWLSTPDKPEFAANLYMARGFVTAVYPHGRDRTLLPYPAIELSCGSLGGMSGGAALDQSGLLVGVISRGLNTAEGDGPTYLSWIISALGRKVELCWPSGLYKTPVSPLSINEGLIFIDKREALAGTTDAQLRYKIW
jgi:hypothetical protein